MAKKNYRREPFKFSLNTLILIIGLTFVFALALGYMYGKKGGLESINQLFQTNKTISENNGSHTYKSNVNKISFTYPKEWNLDVKTDYVWNNTSDESYTLTTMDNREKYISYNVEINLNFRLEHDTTGGCPSISPSPGYTKASENDQNNDYDIITVKKVDILHNNLYLIFRGNKSKNIIYKTYVSNSPDGGCDTSVRINSSPNSSYIVINYQRFADFPNSGIEYVGQNADEFLRSKALSDIVNTLESIQLTN